MVRPSVSQRQPLQRRPLQRQRFDNEALTLPPLNVRSGEPLAQELDGDGGNDFTERAHLPARRLIQFVSNSNQP